MMNAKTPRRQGRKQKRDRATDDNGCTQNLKSEMLYLSSSVPNLWLDLLFFLGVLASWRSFHSLRVWCRNVGRDRAHGIFSTRINRVLRVLIIRGANRLA